MDGSAPRPAAMMSAALHRLSRPILNLFGFAPEPDPEDYPDAGSGLHRLFVAGVPKLFGEQDLRPLFAQCGDVREVLLLKDKASGQFLGCAYVSYAAEEDANKAISLLHRAVHLPGAPEPIEVRHARKPQPAAAAAAAGAGGGSHPQPKSATSSTAAGGASASAAAAPKASNNRQLFFAHMPVVATQEDVSRLFSQFGQVEEVDLFCDSQTSVSKGCGFITMSTQEAAQAAMAALDEKHTLGGCATPLAVKWVDPWLVRKKRKAAADGNAGNRMLFFAKVLRTATEQDVGSLFSQFGKVCDVNLFRAFQGAPTTKGCGLITMGSNEEAMAAMKALDGRFVWEGMDAPIVVKKMDVALQKQRREEHLMRQGLTRKGLGAASDSWLAAATSWGGAAGAGGGAEGSQGDAPPLGCAPDAYKLFVGNIPRHLKEQDLLPLFEAVGRVVECFVVREKGTAESKGSAFVWYVDKATTDLAVEQLNNKHVLPHPPGEMVRPMVVRRANSRKGLPAAPLAPAGVGFGGGGGSSSSVPTGGQLVGRVGSSDMMVPVHVQGMLPHHHHHHHQQQQQQQQQQQVVFSSLPVSLASMPSNLGLDASGTSMLDGFRASRTDPGLALPPRGVQQATLAMHPQLQPSHLAVQTQQAAAAQQQQQQQQQTQTQTQQHAAAAAAAPVDGPPLVPAAAALMASPLGLVPVQFVPTAGGQPVPYLAGSMDQGMGLVGMQQHGVRDGALEPGTPMAVPAPDAPAGAAAAAPRLLSLSVTTGQLQVLHLHLLDIQSLTRTSISTQPVAPGVFYVHIAGAAGQLEAAHSMIIGLLAQLPS